MAESFVGEIRMFGGNFAPVNWALCDGQLLSVNDNDALFSLLGTTYGGDGRTTFGLPDLRGRVLVSQGTGPGLSQRPLGQKAGAEQVSITQATMPAHPHAIVGAAAAADTSSPANARFGVASANVYTTDASPEPMNGGMLQSAGGGGQPHDNTAPTITLNFIISLYGIYPSRD